MLRLASVALAFALMGMDAHGEEITAERGAKLRHFVLHDCGSCHGMTMKGGLGSPLNPDDLAAYDEADIIAVILDGVPGTPMPPWRGLVSPDDAAWIARELKSGSLR